MEPYHRLFFETDIITTYIIFLVCALFFVLYHRPFRILVLVRTYQNDPSCAASRLVKYLFHIRGSLRNARKQY